MELELQNLEFRMLAFQNLEFRMLAFQNHIKQVTGPRSLSDQIKCIMGNQGILMSDCKNKHLVGAYMLTESSTVGTGRLTNGTDRISCKNLSDSCIERRNSCLMRNKTRLVTYMMSSARLRNVGPRCLGKIFFT